MNISDKIAAVLSFAYTQVNVTETLDLFEATIRISSPKAFNAKDLVKVREVVGPRDILTVGVLADDTYVSYKFAPESNDLFTETWRRSVLAADKDSHFDLTIRIEKSVNPDDFVHIYQGEIFLQYLADLDVIDFITVINEKFAAGATVLRFLAVDNAFSFSTRTVSFQQSDSPRKENIIEVGDRKRLLEKQQSVCHFSSIPNCTVLPDDFFLLDVKGQVSQNLLHKFDQACLALSIGAIFDYANLDGALFSVRLNGYKSSRTAIPFDAVNKALVKAYLEIYHWIYQNGGLQDKIGLARNLISLNFENGDGYTLSDTTFSAITSGYKVYEKQNVKQYIELRNKMSDQLIGYNEKASKITESFASNFQKSALTFVTLFSSIVVVKALTTGDVKGAFSKDAVILSIAFLVCSFLYFLASIWEINQQKNRFDRSYDQMKKRNQDLLTADDIDRILNNDEEHKGNVSYIQNKRNIYGGLWVGSIIVFGIAVFFLKANTSAINNQLPRQADSVDYMTSDDSSRKKNIVDSTVQGGTSVKKGVDSTKRPIEILAPK